MNAKPIRRLLVANRGEVAIRVARTARRLGIACVGVASAADRDAPHVHAFDRVVAIGGTRPADSYLRIDAMLEAARIAGADAVHPGWGFLAENADFADAVIGAGCAWIGPPPAAMRAMADKAAARRLVAALGVPVLPGYDGDDQDAATLAGAAARIGYPLLVKAAAGGGGRGMRVVEAEAGLAGALSSAAAEAKAAFGDGRVLLERWLAAARHVELQVFGDHDGAVVHLGERDCSVQRRHQKLIEEAPSPAVTPALRRRMGDAAVAIALSVGYVGAGTVEFLLEAGSDDEPRFWFIEMNARLQVEHAVTEAVVGRDLVEWQLRTAEGAPVPWSQAEALARFEAGGHAVEARLCAEDPAQGFLPQAGRIVRWSVPPAVRVEHAVRSGAVVAAEYDSMLGKIVAHAASRGEALARLAAALDATVCLGVTTNRCFLACVVRDPGFAAGEATTSFVAERFASDEMRRAPANSALEALAAAATALLPRGHLPMSWAGWSSSPVVERTVPLEVGGTVSCWRIAGSRDALALRRDAGAGVAAAAHRIDALVLRHVDVGGGEVEAVVDGRLVRAEFARDGDRGWWLVDGDELAVVDARLRAAVSAGAGRAAAGGTVLAPMHGRITELRVVAGERVEAGSVLLVIEAMKMEHELRAERAGTVAAIHAGVGDQVAARQRLVDMLPASG